MGVRVVVSAGVVLWVNGIVLGRTTSFAWTIDTPDRPVRTIDRLTPAELVPVGATVSGTIGVVRTAQDAGAEGAGLTVPIPDLPRGRYVTLQLVELKSDRTIFRADRARITRQAWSAAAKGVLTGNLAFSAIDGYGTIRPRAR